MPRCWSRPGSATASTSSVRPVETSGRYRPAVAVQGGSGLRRSRLRFRLGQRAGHVSRGEDQLELDAGRRPPGERGRQDQVCRGRLRRLPQSGAVYAVIATATDGHRPAPRRARGAPGGSAKRANGRVRRRIRSPGRRGRNDSPRDTLARSPAVAVCRAGEDAPPAPDDSRGDERGTAAAVAGRGDEGGDATISVCAALLGSEHSLRHRNRIRHQYQSAGEPPKRVPSKELRTSFRIGPHAPA